MAAVRPGVGGRAGRRADPLISNLNNHNDGGEIMGKVAQEVVQRAGVDVDELVRKLVRAAAAEFTTYYYYTILRVNAIGFDGEGLKEIIEDARIEDRNH